MELTKPQVLLIATASLVYLSQGYAHVIFNGLITLDSFTKQFPETDVLAASNSHMKAKAALLQGTVIAILDIGSTIGSLTCWFLGDILGRKRLVYMTLVFATIGVVLQLTSMNFPQLLIGRVLAGLGLGCFSATIPMWLSECLSSKNRGKLCLFTGIFANFGQVVSTCVALAVYPLKASPVSWRLPVALQLVPLCVIAVIGHMAPESPRWLVRKNEVKAAVDVLAQIKGCDPDHSEVHVEICEIQVAASETIHSEMIGSRKTVYRGVLAVSLCVLVTMSGNNALSFFSTEVFQGQLHFSPVQSRALSVGLQASQMLFAFASCFLIERLGRVRIMMISAVLMAIGMASIAGIDNATSSPAGTIFGVIFQFFVMCCYPIGFHTTPYLYASEISPLPARHRIVSLASSAHWVFNFLVAEITPIAFTSIGGNYYFVYLCTNLCTFAALFLLYPETKGLNLESIDDIFMSSSNPLKIPRYARMRTALQNYDASNSSETLCEPEYR